MGKISVTTTATTVVRLKTSTKLRLQSKLKAYEAKELLYDKLGEELDALNAEVEALRETTGEGKLDLDGFKVTRMDGQRTRKLNKMKFVELGGDLDVLEAATEEKPKKAYTLISCPSKKKRNPQEED